MPIRNVANSPADFPQEKIRDIDIGVWETSTDEAKENTKTRRRVTVKEKQTPRDKPPATAHVPPLHYKNKVEKARALKDLLELEPSELLQEAPYACDSLSALKQIPQYVPTTPNLDLPDPAFIPHLKKTKSLIETQVIQCLEELREANLLQQNLEMDFLSVKSDGIYKLHLEQMAKLDENARKLAQTNNWALLHAVADGVISAVTVLAGVAAAPSMIGFCMIGLGGLSLTNLLFSQLGVWETLSAKLAGNDLEMQKTLRMALPGAITVVCSLVGPILLANGMFKLGFSATRDLPVIFETTVAFTKSAIGLGSGISSLRLDYAQADLVEIQQKISVNTVLSERVMNLLDTMLKELDQHANKVARILKMSTRMQRKIARIRG